MRRTNLLAPDEALSDPAFLAEIAALFAEIDAGSAGIDWQAAADGLGPRQIPADVEFRLFWAGAPVQTAPPCGDRASRIVPPDTVEWAPVRRSARQIEKHGDVEFHAARQMLGRDAVGFFRAAVRGEMDIESLSDATKRRIGQELRGLALRGKGTPAGFSRAISDEDDEAYERAMLWEDES